ncbi:hypothetical protein ScPMuIL_018859 [Solemya velum]
MDFKTVLQLVAIHLVAAQVRDTTGDETHDVCPQGWYHNSDPNGEFCLACPDGQTSAWNSSTADACQNECVPGTYSDDGSGNAPCSLCPVNTYNNKLTGSTSIDDCVACPYNYSTIRGGFREDYCLPFCFFGTYSNNTEDYAPDTMPGSPPCTNVPRTRTHRTLLGQLRSVGLVHKTRQAARGAGASTIAKQQRTDNHEHQGRHVHRRVERRTV